MKHLNQWTSLSYHTSTFLELLCKMCSTMKTLWKRMWYVSIPCVLTLYEILSGLVLVCAVYFLLVVPSATFPPSASKQWSAVVALHSCRDLFQVPKTVAMWCAASVLVSLQSADRQWNSLYIASWWNWAAGSTKDFQGDPNCHGLDKGAHAACLTLIRSKG